jgi:D-alanyl-lipoteichoic acid acyltransferase DltB (MBOAT superfamily)
MTQQENFDKPILARNLLDFWNRWHISLTLWIRDYVFTPLYKSAATHWRHLAVPLGYCTLFVALFLAGLWHGATWNFVLFGLMHGAGVVTVQIYGDRLKRRLGRQGVKRYLSNRAVRTAAVLVTVHYVCVSFLFFRPGLRQTLDLLSRAREGIF